MAAFALRATSVRIYCAAISHLAELVRGHLLLPREGPLIRPIVPEARLRHDGAPSPQGEKGPRGSHWRFRRSLPRVMILVLLAHTSPASPCTVPEGFVRLASAEAEIAYRWEPERLKVGQFFAAEVIACR